MRPGNSKYLVTNVLKCLCGICTSLPLVCNLAATANLPGNGKVLAPAGHVLRNQPEDNLPPNCAGRLGTLRFRQLFSMHSLVWSPDGRVIGAANKFETSIFLWDQTNGNLIAAVPSQYPATAFLFGSDSKKLIMASF